MDESKLLYSKTHEWAAVDGKICVVGVTKFAVEQLTDIVYIELPDVGRKVAAGEAFGVIESVKAVSDLNAPVAGEVVEVNQSVVDDPAILSDDPYAGWMIKLKTDDGFDTSGLNDKAAYDLQIASEDH